TKDRYLALKGGSNQRRSLKAGFSFSHLYSKKGDHFGRKENIVSTLDGRYKLRGLRGVIVVAMCLLVSAFFVLMVIPSNPLRQNEEELHAWVLAETPMGSSMEDVANAIERHKWKRDPGQNENLGFYKQQGFIGVVGSKSIHADLG